MSRISGTPATEPPHGARNPDAEVPPPAGPNEEADLEELITDRIVIRLKQKFAGVRLERLVASILRASDYQVLETAAGPDGGVDIVAGAGELGFGQPRLCVQVKGRRGPVDLAEYDRLMGNLETFRAEHGLLVSLGGFTKPVKDRNTQTFFRIRLWGADELAQRLLDAYEELPVDIRADVPLRDRKGTGAIERQLRLAHRSWQPEGGSGIASRAATGSMSAAKNGPAKRLRRPDRSRSRWPIA